MNRSISNSIEQFVNTMREWQLALIVLSDDANKLQLTFAASLESSIVLTCTNVHYLALSRHPTDQGNWLVGEARLHLTNGTGLQELGFGFSSAQPTGDADATQFYHLHIEGDVVLDVVSDDISLE